MHNFLEQKSAVLIIYIGAAKEFGYPLVLKAKALAYDGRGNFTLESAADIEEGLSKIGAKNLYVEKWVCIELNTLVKKALGLILRFGSRTFLTTTFSS